MNIHARRATARNRKRLVALSAAGILAAGAAGGAAVAASASTGTAASAEASITVFLPSGAVTGYQAAPGWDPVTGWGSPDAQVLVPLLGQYVRPGDGNGL